MSSQKAVALASGKNGGSTAIGGRRFTRVRGMTLVYWRTGTIAERDISGRDNGLPAPRCVCEAEQF